MPTRVEYKIIHECNPETLIVIPGTPLVVSWSDDFLAWVVTTMEGRALLLSYCSRCGERLTKPESWSISFGNSR